MMSDFQLDLKGRVLRERVVKCLSDGLVQVLEPALVPAERINTGFFNELRDRIKKKERVKRE